MPADFSQFITNVDWSDPNRSTQKNAHWTPTKNDANFSVVVEKCTRHETADCVIQNCYTFDIYIL